MMSFRKLLYLCRKFQLQVVKCKLQDVRFILHDAQYRLQVVKLKKI